MDRLILDTEALIALERRHADRAAVLPDDADVAISAISASELFVGAELADEDAPRPPRRSTASPERDKTRPTPQPQ
ncbi:MAG: hypothetical protein M3071_21325 [Actinomycetota bacterium]|nr:hypothetical protein [Actinomycetota bacterium]